MSDTFNESRRDRRAGEKSRNAFRTISEVADELNVPQHVLRFWETKFAQIKPMKRGGGRRYYRPEDVEVLKVIQHLLYDKGYTIRGVQKLFKEHGVKTAVEALQNDAEIGFVDPNSDKPAAPVSPIAGVPSGGELTLKAAKAILEELKSLRQALG